MKQLVNYDHIPRINHACHFLIANYSLSLRHYKLNLSYYASIMLDAFKDLLCSKLCWHNRPGPSGAILSRPNIALFLLYIYCYTVEPLLLYRGCPLSAVKLYCHGPVGSTELVLYREVKCAVSLETRVF